MESESLSIDPRYRPEFQRGYSRMTVPVAPTPRTDEPALAGLPPVMLSGAESAVVTEAPSRDSYSAKPQRNPYLFAIPVVACVFLILGTWLLISQFVWSYSGQFGSGNSVERRLSGVDIRPRGICGPGGRAFLKAARWTAEPVDDGEVTPEPSL